ncbi:hypothetical protein ARAM_001698 [Aspergillus rambellii]|uniref:Zn(2)-C6 fungal-type domain-containing protein n=1 Tax=Aspergillus rambellii TaxID=308745 RepID=A0A0F8VFB0_9EURO|nr:hypothetical protein ARAM_001698 [Aspergillus rambellii]
MPSTPSTTSARRHQSGVACQACRRRKVRCSFSVTGVPCTACTQDQVECLVNTKQLNRFQRNRTPVTPSLRPIAPAQTHGVNGSSSSNKNDLPSEPNVAGNTATPLSGGPHNIEAEERNGVEIATAALGQPQNVGEVPFYTGEGTGPTSALNICSLPRHFFIPVTNRVSLSDEDRNYLQIKGVFTLPSKAVCDSFLRAYFYHVHPVMPVIDVNLLLNMHHSGRLQEYNLLLLWSIFFVAVNFVPANVYEQEEGCNSRREMKAMFYSRAKCMYDNGAETDKIVLLQSSLLLGFWYSELDEHMQPWYWTGIAIDLCQMLGLHRDPHSSKANSSITPQQWCLWRRLWWSCFFRDRWLGLTLGRPLRINLNDCDTPMPVVADMLSDMDRIPDSAAAAAYLPNDFPRLAQYWVKLIELSKVLGTVITMNYQAVRPRPSLQQFETVEQDILRFQLPDLYEAGLSRWAGFYAYHVHLHYQALAITFYRPYERDTPEGLDPNEEEDWRHRVRSKADAAASRTNYILDALVQGKLLEYVGPMTPPLLIPAMQTHLLHCKRADPLSKRLRLNKLDMCILILEELQKTYTAASIYRVLFIKAIQQIFPGYSKGIEPLHQNAPAASGAGASNATDPTSSTTGSSAEDPITYDVSLSDDQEADAAATDSFVHALTDEASIFNLLGNMGSDMI